MRTKALFFLVFLFSTLTDCPTVLGEGRMGPTNFRFSAKLDAEIKKGGLYKVILQGGVLEQSERSCRDMRLFDKEAREIPFVILDNRIPPKKTLRFPLEVISYDDQATRTIIVLKRAKPIEPVTRLEMDSPDRDFSKAVTVSGSNDMKSWRTLGHETIYDFSSRVSLRKMYLTVEKNSYLYFQLTIDEGKETGNFQNIRLKYEGIDFSASAYTKKKLQVKGFVVLDDAEGSEKTVYDERKLLPKVSTDPAKRVSEIAFNSVLPFSTLEFAIDNPYYCRRLKLYGANTGRKQDLALIKQDALYSFPISTQTETKKQIDVSLPHPYQSYKIVIENEANPPLEIKSMTLRWRQKQLFFIGLDDHQEYRLFWGSSTVEDASYEIARLVRPDNWFNQPAIAVQVSSAVQNADYKPFKERDGKTLLEKNVLVFVVVFVVIVIGFFLFQLWKKTG